MGDPEKEETKTDASDKYPISAEDSSERKKNLLEKLGLES